MVLPFYLRATDASEGKVNIILLFEVNDFKNTTAWCIELSTFLEENHLKATIFFSGKVAEKHGECVKCFSNSIDIGSQTFSYIDLTSIEDYEIQLEEVKRGKEIVDDAGNLDSKLFRAPYGLTDENIYSLLYRSNIIADFSYEQQYNKYCEDQFLKFKLQTYNSSENSPDFFRNLIDRDDPVAIVFDLSDSIGHIEEFILELKSENVRFLSTSELTGLELTVRRS
jgi:peptidoglycan/xylan/chitin deacetylase (PgdA/CDA1 family)